MALRLHLRDVKPSLISAWEQAFAGVSGVEISRGDIFSTRAGVVPDGDPIDVKADAVISPANSFGFMDGGIDAVYTRQLGEQVQRVLQQKITDEFDGELPVGMAVIVPTGNHQIPWCISAPTMRAPSEIIGTANAFLAFRGALLAVLRHNASEAQKIETILCPGLGTAIGRLSPVACARQMRAAWERIALGNRFVPRSIHDVWSDDDQLRVDVSP